jgi:membrane-associated protein
VNLINFFIEILFNFYKYLDLIIPNYGIWAYAIFFLIIFSETGFVVTPFLPGDSLLFALGTFAALVSLDVRWSVGFLSIAAIAGDTVNYWIGNFTGPKVFKQEKSLFLNKEYLHRAHQFYEKYGGETIILARFIPIIRTFASFVAGIGSMTYKRFIIYNIFGGLAWVAIFVFGGYFFDNIPFIKNHFSLFIFAIIFLSILPGIIEFIRQRYQL